MDLIKTKTSLDKTAKGEKRTITRNGISHKAIIDGMRKLRNRVKPDKVSAKDMISEGRRF